ncbi:MAG TPA: hypothetical protein EYN73_09410 [Chromatiaceae bacterium]|jgi:hypothetical protein|nr:hypothetical protein [Chromatiaceae bacterium]HIN83158.1 hypothetical protein [Chromatiales bacterium]HIA09262.1 hypothetical protein [Chromatiaceae bacterium]HIB84187.1 hypothetical protein [Chromatiaceae bacterium]HIO13841.1 hypothetical protein [Chromatiales bacterium]
MKLPIAELGDIFRTFASVADELTEQIDNTQDMDPSPELLLDAMNQLADVLLRIDEDAENEPTENDADSSDTLKLLDITRLGNWGFQIFNDMLAIATAASMPAASQSLNSLYFPFALWIARHDGELSELNTVVNTAAHLANHVSDHLLLADLYVVLGELLDAVTPDIRNDLDSTNPGRPWRILNLNRAIVATRSHNPQTMDAAFRTLVDNIPDDAASFFREGMEQMEALDYPAPVRDVMERYYTEWCKSPKILH